MNDYAFSYLTLLVSSTAFSSITRYMYMLRMGDARLPGKRASVGRQSLSFVASTHGQWEPAISATGGGKRHGLGSREAWGMCCLNVHTN